MEPEYSDAKNADPSNGIRQLDRQTDAERLTKSRDRIAQLLKLLNETAYITQPPYREK